MNLLNYFRTKRNKASASIARERLQIIVAHERMSSNQPDYLPRLEQDLIRVISQYVDIDRDQVAVTLDNNDDCAVLELNITLPQ